MDAGICFDNKQDLIRLIEERQPDLFQESSNDIVGLMGVVEFTNYCKNACYYCKNSRDNWNLERFRYMKEEILDCCKMISEAGIFNLLLRGGEDLYFDRDKILEILRSIKLHYPKMKIFLSIGEGTGTDYEEFYKAGASVYFIKHQAADENYFQKIHPLELSLSFRKECIELLQKTNLELGAGFLIGAPWQAVSELAEDLLYLNQIKPDVIEPGLFLSDSDMNLKDFPKGDIKELAYFIMILRMMFPEAWITFPDYQVENLNEMVASGMNLIQIPVSVMQSSKELKEKAIDLMERIEKMGYQLEVI